jgi:CheY-like chemotaxis protein
MGMTTWILLAVVLLYVMKTLYDVNLRNEEVEEEYEVIEELKSEYTTNETDFSSSSELPPPVTLEDSFRKAQEYVLDEKESDQISNDTPLLVVKNLIPETEHVDLDCFLYFKGARLLLVEDNLLNQRIITSVLKQSGIEIDIAENGEIALEYLLGEHREYDLILMDISMPVMDGITATSIIRRAQRFNRLPIIAFTAFSLGDEISAMFDVGANAYLTKPLNVGQLYTIFMLFIGNVNRGLSLQKQLEIQGLDIDKGLENVHGDLPKYREVLEEFVQRYESSVESIPQWIDEERYERVRLECKEILPMLNQIGAYDMYHMVQEIQLQFIYQNEHLLDRFKLLYRGKMQALIDTIKFYLESEGEKFQKVLAS